MGCTSSKLDDLPAVALCRERCAFLDEAIHRRYALAEAHAAYLHSLKCVGLSLHRFFHQDLSDTTAGGPPSPVLNLPPNRKVDPEPSGSPAPAPVSVIPRSQSNSGHLEFNSDSEESGSEAEYLHHHLDNYSSIHPYGQFDYGDNETLGPFTYIHYMKNQATSTLVYEQRPTSPDTVQRAQFYSYNPNPYPYSDQNPSSYSSYNYGAFIASSSQTPPVLATSTASTSSKQPPPPPPPPPPPRGSAWEFINPFESYEEYYPPYTPSRNSKEEGIPDLEDEDHRPEILKEVLEDRKSADGVGSNNESKRIANDDDNVKETLEHERASVSTEDDSVEDEVHMVDEKVVKEEKPGDRENVNVHVFKARDDSEVVKEIEVQFERATECGNELAKILEVGKLPYNRKHAAYQGSSKMLNVIAPLSVASLQPSSTSRSAESSSVEMADPAYQDIDGDVGMGSKNLSSTLKKLYLWEKKLYEEIKIEEKMRVLHERKCRKLKHLDERGAEPHKVDTTRSLVHSLSTKIRIAIQVVDKISVKINKLRDEELWPQLYEFIQGSSRMWKSMLECHQSQCQAIGEAKQLDAISTRKHLRDAHLEATLQLEKELLNWTLKFSCWVSAQKHYVRALNEWLLKSLLYEPEETPDGIAPFSPGRIGAPPVFVSCNQWSQALERISEKEVLDSMRDLATSVFQLWERDKLEMGQRTMGRNDIEREDKKIHKEIEALDKRMGNSYLETGQVVYQSDTSTNRSLQLGLQHVFEAMERFATSSSRSYEELLQSIEEDRCAQEHEGVS
ncbi:hypothetical protein LguiA_027712 [Lonicera macranthoides]